jgi:signal peptidase I
MHRGQKSQRRTLKVFALAFLFFGWWLTLAPHQLGGPVSIAVVKGNSMVGTLESGDLLIAYRATEYKIGDDVLYERFGGYVIHQLVGLNPDGTYITKGVNNQAIDPWKVPKENILGVKVLIAPGLGKDIQTFLNSPFSVGLTAVLVSLIIIVPMNRTRRYGEARSIDHLKGTERVRFRGHRTLLFWTLTVAAVVVLAMVVVLALANVPFWPRIAIGIGVLVLLSAALVMVGIYLFDGVGLKDPLKSMVILGPTFYRIPAHLKLEAQTHVVASAKELRVIKNELNTVVLHRVSSSGTHEFIICGHAENFIFTCGEDK